MSYTDVNVVPKLEFIASAPIISTKVSIADSRRFRESSKTTVFDNNTYLDIGKSTGAARFQLAFDVSKYKSPVESAHLMLAWYYPSGKSRVSDTVVTAYRPLAALSDNMTWATSSENYNKAQPYGSVTIKGAVLPDGKFEAIDITDLVNEYIMGTYTNTGVFVKSRAEANNYIAFHGESAIENSVKPYVLIKTKEIIS